MKKLIGRLVNKAKNGIKAVAATTSAIALSAFSATSAFAATGNSDLSTATADLTNGISDMKTNALLIISAVILVIVVVFGIGWLIGIVKRMMSKA